MSCGGYQVYATNLQDIMLLRLAENKDVKLLPIHPEEVSNAAELRSLLSSLDSPPYFKLYMSLQLPENGSQQYSGQSGLWVLPEKWSGLAAKLTNQNLTSILNCFSNSWEIQGQVIRQLSLWTEEFRGPVHQRKKRRPKTPWKWVRHYS